VLLKPRSNNTLKGVWLRQAVAVAQMLDTAEKSIEGQGLANFSKMSVTEKNVDTRTNTAAYCGKLLLKSALKQ
jgi:hypothetical protein